MYPQAICRTITTMGPTYLLNIYAWFKMALWDAPYRVWLDVELEKLTIERNLSNIKDEKTVKNERVRDTC
jgi:hypothetical protein